MQLMLDILKSISDFVVAFWIFLTDVVTALQTLWQSALEIRTVRNLSALSWGDLPRRVTQVQWIAVYEQSVVAAKFVVGVASVVSAITTIIGVRYYFRQNDAYRKSQKYAALQQIYLLIFTLIGVASKNTSWENINLARKELNLFIKTNMWTFEKKEREELETFRSRMDKDVHDVFKPKEVNQDKKKTLIDFLEKYRDETEKKLSK